MGVDLHDTALSRWSQLLNIQNIKSIHTNTLIMSAAYVLLLCYCVCMRVHVLLLSFLTTPTVSEYGEKRQQHHWARLGNGAWLVPLGQRPDIRLKIPPT